MKNVIKQVQRSIFITTFVKVLFLIMLNAIAQMSAKIRILAIVLQVVPIVSFLLRFVKSVYKSNSFQSLLTYRLVVVHALQIQSKYKKTAIYVHKIVVVVRAIIHVLLAFQDLNY